MSEDTTKDLVCSFCDRGTKNVERSLRHGDLAICNWCAESFIKILGVSTLFHPKLLEQPVMDFLKELDDPNPTIDTFLNILQEETFYWEMSESAEEDGRELMRVLAETFPEMEHTGLPEHAGDIREE